MSKLNELKKSILADGVIDEQEAKQLREVLYADGVIEKEEAEFFLNFAAISIQYIKEKIKK